MKGVDWGKTLTSKTVWLGILEILTGTGGILDFILTLPPKASAILIISGVATIIIRYLTKEPIKKKEDK